MATLLTHALWGVALGQAAGRAVRRDARFWCAAVLCSALPDVDVIGFGFGIHYGDLWGHRGLTHSLIFAALTGIVAGVLLGDSARERRALAALLFLITASHGVLDAMTDGGLGVAFFSPFDTRRYFLPWRPIRVAPLGLYAAVSGRWLSVLESEARSVWLPALLLGVLLHIFRAKQEHAARIAPGAHSR